MRLYFAGLLIALFAGLDAHAEVFDWPIAGAVPTQDYGCRLCLLPSSDLSTNYLEGNNIHTGLDMDVSGEPIDPYSIAVFPAAEGILHRIVDYDEVGNNLGNTVIIRHPIDNIFSIYAHLDQINPDLRIGTFVQTTLQIGTMGNSVNGVHRPPFSTMPIHWFGPGIVNTLVKRHNGVGGVYGNEKKVLA
ncbi:MAG: M23 family metallopeptidase [bacterium]